MIALKCESSGFIMVGEVNGCLQRDLFDFLLTGKRVGDRLEVNAQKPLTWKGW